MRRRLGTRARRVGHLLRLLSALLLTVVLSQSTLAFAFPCAECVATAGERSYGEERGGREHDEERCPCPCPFDCAPCCAGGALRAVAPAPLDLVLPSPLTGEIVWLCVGRAPPSNEPSEILHVPKPGA